MAEKPIVNIEDVPMREVKKGTRYEARLGRIGGVIGASQLGAQYHLVPPGKAAFPRHAHHSNEEMMVVLQGGGEYQCGNDVWPVRAGDVISAPASDGSRAHQLRNTGAQPLAYLAISTRHDPDVTEYPDSGKVAVASGILPGQGMASAKTSFLWRQGAAPLDYWDGEDIGDTQ